MLSNPMPKSIIGAKMKFEVVDYTTFFRDSIKADSKLTPDIIEKAYSEVEIPTRKTSGSAGYDFICPYDILLAPGGVAKIPTGIKAQMDKDVVLLMFVRSSIGINRRMAFPNGTAVIDSDYYGNPDNEGDIMLVLVNNNEYDVKVFAGERVAQGVFVNYLLTDDDASDGTRTGGIGSTDG